MSKISSFYGIKIHMFADDHLPPHFHAKYAEFEAIFNIETLEITKGKIPRNALKLVIEWAIEHRKELKENWKLCEQSQQPNEIEPLE